MANLVVGPFVEKFTEKIIEIFSHYAQDQFKWQTGMKDELKRLRDNCPKIQAVVSTARKAQTIDQNSPLNKWIWQLRDAIDEADDLLDDLEYKEHQQHGYLQKIIQVGERAIGSDPYLKRLVEVMHKFDRISADVGNFLHLLEGLKQEQREQEVELRINRETGSSAENDLIGRDNEKEQILQWLRNPLDETTTGLYRNVSVLSIVGHGGMGKTTLLQHVYENEITKEFPHKMWVSVSDSFDVKKVIQDMLESLQNKRPSVETLHTLQRNLKFELKSKKFLLVLDDLWDKEEEDVLSRKWGKVFSALACGGLGSKILITTRTSSVASIIAKVISKDKEVLRLEGLKEDECLRLLTTYAFPVEENPNDHKKLKFIAEGLVKKLFGSPLAAKVLGGALSSNLDERHWRNVLNNSLAHNDISSILKLSYIFLPEHLQSCFSFCSIFKQDHIFDKKELVRMWIAVGFIQPSYIQGETLEDIGERYFDVLIKKSFFDSIFQHQQDQLFEKYVALLVIDGFLPPRHMRRETLDVSFKKKFFEGNTIKYKMHDLLHELAQSVSRQECFRFVGDEESPLLEIPETIRHLSIKTSNSEVLKKLERFKNLRTLSITDNRYDSYLSYPFFENFHATRSIRLLHLSSPSLKAIPEEIEYLQHLRYLRFDSVNVKLTSSLSSLYHLQFIILFEMYSPGRIDSFREDMNNLCNLRYLSYPRINFPGIGKLKFLQELDGFCIMNEIGYGIQELEHMNELRIIKLTNLENVRDAQDARNAKLCDKRNLACLTLDWSDCVIADRDLDERVLNNLQPHNYLKTLTIINYMGARSASWMNEANLLNNLEAIYLGKCLEWEILPPFGQLPFLKALYLEHMPKAKCLENKFDGEDMCCVFQSLQWLSFRKLEALVDWFDTTVLDGLFPSLTKLFLSDCPNLQELPCMPHKLETLKIHNIGWKTLNCKKSIPLKTLEVHHCPNITSISLPDEIGKLKYLTIEDCPSLQFLSSSTNISLVDNIFLKSLPQLQKLPDGTLSVESLKINDCNPELMKRYYQF